MLEIVPVLRVYKLLRNVKDINFGVVYVWIRIPGQPVTGSVSWAIPLYSQRLT